MKTLAVIPLPVMLGLLLLVSPACSKKAVQSEETLVRYRTRWHEAEGQRVGPAQVFPIHRFPEKMIQAVSVDWIGIHQRNDSVAKMELGV